MIYFKAPGGELIPYTGVLDFHLTACAFEKGMDDVCVTCGTSVLAHFSALACYGKSRSEAYRFIRMMEDAAYALISQGRGEGIIDVKETVGDGFEELSSFRERCIPRK